jgi:ComF family protein
MLVADFLFPRECHICGVKLNDAEKYLCTSCLASMSRSLYHARPMNPMEQRFAGIIPFERGTGHFLYARDAAIATVVHDFKYHRFRGLARYMGCVMARELLSTGFLSSIDCIIPIPMHFMKQAKRGYNPAAEVALGLGKEADIQVADNLRASRPHRTQTALTLDQRRENTRNLFTVKRPEELQNKHILLLDDICTTGATLLSASETLLAAVPSIRISLLTLGVTY